MNEHPNTHQGSTRKLYRIKDGAMISGVCNGLATYFGIDVTIVRILFVVLTILGHGVGILIYGAIMLLAPEIQSVDKPETRTQPLASTPEAKEGLKTAGIVFAWIAVIVGGIVLVALTIAWIISLIALTTSAIILGVPFLIGLSPILIGIIITLVFYVISWPIKELSAKAYEVAKGIRPEHSNSFRRFLGVMGWIVAIVLVVWVISNLFPRVHTMEPYGHILQIDGKNVCIGGNGFCG